MNARHQKPPCACPRDDSGQKEHVADCGNRLMTPLPLPSEAKATPAPLSQSEALTAVSRRLVEVSDERDALRARVAELEKEVPDVELDVDEFFEAMGIHAPASYQPPSEPIRALRANMLVEEAHEFRAAAAAGNVPEMLDGAVDIIYVAIGFFLDCGLPFAPFWAEVHRSNMAKAGGPRREDGKVLKPPGWKPPDIAGVLRRVLAEQEASNG